MAGISIVKVEASNFHRLKVAEAEFIPGEGLVRVTGKNRAGKTSLLRAISGALGGAGEVIGEATIHEGAEDGEVKVTLSNGFSVRRRFTEANPKGYLTVEGPDGGKHTQGKLDEWLGRHAFDPLAFFSLKADRQRDILLGLGEDPDLAEKISDIREQHADLYSQRTPWISQRRRAAGVPKPMGERPEPVDLSAELERQSELRTQQQAQEAAQREVEQVRVKRQRNDEAQLAISNRMAELEEELARQVQLLKEAKEEGQRLDAAIDEMQAKVSTMSDPTEELDQVQQRLREADQIQRDLEPWREWDRAQREQEQAREAEDALTAQMKELEQEEDRLISTAGIPVDGLSFGENGEPLLNGRPLSVASGAERIRLACSVAIATNPQLRVVLVDEANDIDLEGLAELDRMARDHGMQVWVARIGLEGPGEIVVEDGVATSQTPAAA